MKHTKVRLKKSERELKKAFGANESGLADMAGKISGIRVSRVLSGDYAGCCYCFPHGWETVNSKVANRQRSWKKFRRTQWKEK